MRPKLSTITAIRLQPFRAIIIIGLTLVSFFSVTLAGQTKPKLLEAVYFFGLNSRYFQSDYLHQYSPLFEPGPSLSLASHYQKFESTKSKGNGLSMGIFLTKNFGVEISYFYQSSPFSGTSSNYEVFLRYISRPPPSYEPIEATLNWSRPWPNPHGYLDLRVLTLNPVLRLNWLRQWQLCLSAGLATFFLKGELGPIAFTRFWLGGHSVLFSEDYKLLVRFIPNHRVGWNAGTSLSAWVITGIGLTLDLRYYQSGKIPLQLEAKDYDQGYEQQGIQPLTRMQPYLALGRTLFRPSFLSLKLGIKISFF